MVLKVELGLFALRLFFIIKHVVRLTSDTSRYVNTPVVGIAARLVTVVTLVTLDRVAAKQRSGIALVLSSTIDINHQRRETPPLRRFAASRAHVSIADRAYMYPFVVRVTLVRIECMVARLIRPPSFPSFGALR